MTRGLYLMKRHSILKRLIVPALAVIAALVLLAIAPSLQAHDATDWRADKAAYKYTQDRLHIAPEPVRPSGDRFQNFEIDTAFLQDKLSQLSGAKATEIDGKSVMIKERGSNGGRELARKFLEKEFQALGFTTKRQSFTGTFNSGINLVAEKMGDSSSNRVLIISSHIDSVNNAGANDDGAGTISALAIARALSTLKFRHTLRFVGFDKEEAGIVGSRAYAKSVAGDKTIIGDIQLEMMGVNRRKDGAFHVIDCDKAGSTEIASKIMEAAEALALPLKRVAACTERSDHAAFWEVGIPAVVISENFFGGDADPCYHKACDIVDGRLNWPYMTAITNAAASATAVLLEPLE